MPITVHFEESADRTTPEEARGATGPHRRAVPVNQPVEAKGSQRSQQFVRSVKEKKEALEQEKARLALEVDEDTEDEEEISPERVAEKEEEVASILLELSDLVAASEKPPSRLVREVPSALVTGQPRRVFSDSNAPESTDSVPEDSGKRVLRPRGKQPERRLGTSKPAATAKRVTKAKSRAVAKSAPTVPVPAAMASSSKSPTDPVVAKGNKSKPDLSACYNKFRATIIQLLGKEALIAFRKTNINSTTGYLWQQMSQEGKVSFSEQTEEEQRALLEQVMRPDEDQPEETQQADEVTMGEVTKSGRPKRNVAGAKKLQA